MTSSKVALVTGSGKRRIGWHVAQALAARGYSLVIHYNNSAVDAQQTVDDFHHQGIQAIALQADLRDDTAIRALIDKSLAHFGRIDVLVNCAAGWPRKRLEEVTAADVRRQFEINTLGTFLCAQQAGLAMVRQPEGGCIVNFSDWAVIRPYLDYAAYFVSKGAIETMTRCLAVELGSRNPAVRVNCILPGPVLTGELPEEVRRQAIEGTVVKHDGKPESIAQAVLFLIDNDFVTGVSLPVDGGRSVFAPNSL